MRALNRDLLQLYRGPVGAGGSGREPEHEKAAEPKPKTPAVDLGV